MTHFGCLGADDAYLLALRGRVGPSHYDTVVTIATIKVGRTGGALLPILEPFAIRRTQRTNRQVQTSVEPGRPCLDKYSPRTFLRNFVSVLPTNMKPSGSRSVSSELVSVTS